MGGFGHEIAVRMTLVRVLGSGLVGTAFGTRELDRSGYCQSWSDFDGEYCESAGVGFSLAPLTVVITAAIMITGSKVTANTASISLVTLPVVSPNDVIGLASNDNGDISERHGSDAGAAPARRRSTLA